MKRNVLFLVIIAFVLLGCSVLHLGLTNVQAANSQAAILFKEFRLPRLLSALVAGAGQDAGDSC